MKKIAKSILVIFITGMTLVHIAMRGQPIIRLIAFPGFKILPRMACIADAHYGFREEHETHPVCRFESDTDFAYFFLCNMNFCLLKQAMKLSSKIFVKTLK